jgi:hypothetical protein
MFLTSGDAATGVNFNQVMETSPATCRYNVAPTPGTETFVKYRVTIYPQHSGDEPQISVFSGWHQDSPADQPTWQSEEQYPETAVQSGTYDTYKYDYEVTGSGAFLEWSKSTMTGGGWIDSLFIMRGGSGYSSEGNLTASGGGGNGFAGTFTSTVGSPVKKLDIVNAGSGYSLTGTLAATGGGGSGFAGTFDAVVGQFATGQIYSVAITNGGENYYEAPTIIVTSEGGSDSTGAVVQASISPVGVIDSVYITNSGEYYTTNPTVIIDGDGIGGEIMASANPGQPTEPEITGTGYYPLYADNILGSGFFAASGQVTGQPDCFSLALEVSGKYEFEHQEMLNLLSGPDWTPTGMPI